MAFGLESDVMQPSLMKKKGQTKVKKDRIFLTIHVDDLLVVGAEEEVEKFFKYLTGVGWRYEKEGPMEYWEKFEYLKRKIHTCNGGIDCQTREFRPRPSEGLISFMKSPTKKAWQVAVHLVSYLMDTMNEGILLEATHAGKSNECYKCRRVCRRFRRR